MTYEEKREMVWEDYSCGLISQERADEMLRVIQQQEEACERRRDRQEHHQHAV